MAREAHLVSVFTSPTNPEKGGNLTSIVLDASAMSDEEMQAATRRYGHESSFMIPAPPGTDADYQLRFFVPEHEMEMCGHATVGTGWLLKRLGILGERAEVKFATLSGLVAARLAAAQHCQPQSRGEGSERHQDKRNVEISIEISQPQGQVEAVLDQNLHRQIQGVLGVSPDQLLVPAAGDAQANTPIQNACTSRVKTMVPVRDVATLDALQPDFSRIKGLCERLGSTGLYPYAFAQGLSAGQEDSQAIIIHARQFPKASGYPEDAATGIAAAALAFALLENRRIEPGQALVVRQGEAMGSPSEIRVRIEYGSHGEMVCWVGGTARFAQPGSRSTGSGFCDSRSD